MATKRAVVVGINDYAPAGVGGPDLRGCVNDAKDMANTLVVCGFLPLNIRVLTDRNATRSKILTYLKWLLTNSARGDSAVFYYSGHGTRVANIGTDIELDGLDEAICPHDFQTAGVIRDDDFQKVIKENLKPGVNLDVTFDCCHAGTGTRALNLETGEVEQTDMYLYSGERFIEPDFDDQFFFNYKVETPKKKRSKTALLRSSDSIERVSVIVPGTNHTLWAACRDNQVSVEGPIGPGGTTRGYFTFHYCKVLRATVGNITRKKLDVMVTAALANMGAAQVPQTETTSAELLQKVFA